VEELAELGTLENGTVEVRTHRGAPHFKPYLVNGADAFFGFYPVVRRTVTVHGKRTPMFDVLGKDVPLSHFAAEDDETSEGSQYIHQAQAWYDSASNA
jgi:hypothetical protein